MEINDLLKKAVDAGASDLHIKVGSPPVARINGVLKPIDETRLTREEALRLAMSVMSPSQKETYKKELDIDFAHSVPGLGRFRCSAFLQRGAVGIVFRVIPTRIPDFDELNLPDVLRKLAAEERGMVLVTGTTGSGKSTTLAALIDQINATKTVNIITIEDPVEYLHRDKKSLINQREIGADARSFAKALRAALRQDPDVILVGEMRDFDTIQTALMAAETGHLVLSTLHTLDAPETINRIISFFPPYYQQQVRVQLATVLKGIVSMRLVPKPDGKGRVPAVEVLLATATVKDCIMDPAKTKCLPDVIAQGNVHYAMQTFDQSLFSLLKQGLVTQDDALRNASNPDDFMLKLQGVHNTAEAFNQKKGGDDPLLERFAK